MRLDEANWARTVGAFQETYQASKAPVVDEQTKIAGARASERAYDAAKAGQDFTENFMSNSSVGGREANAAGNSLLAQGFSRAEAAASARYAGQAAAYYASLKPEEKPTEEEPPTEEKPPTEDKGAGGGGGGGGPAPTFIDPTTVATASVNEQILALQAQIASMQAAAAAEAAKPKVVGQKTVRKTGGVVEVSQPL